jgi:hypothetical protein
MLAPETVREIRRLLVYSQLSQRQIARLVNVSQGTVSAIARGRRSIRSASARQEPLPLPRGPVARCPGCGARVRMPCLACSIRRSADRRDRSPSGDAEAAEDES